MRDPDAHPSRAEPPAASAAARSRGDARSAARRALASSGAVAAVVVLLLFVWHARAVLLLGFAGLLLAIFFRRLARWIADRTPLRPRAALPIVIVGITAVFVGIFWLRGPAIAVEVRALRETLPVALEQLEQRLAHYDWGQRVIDNTPSAAELLPNEADVVTHVPGVLSRTVSTLARVAVVLFLGIVLAATPRVYVRGLLALLPEDRVDRGHEVIVAVANTLWWWLIGRAISMTFLGVITWIGLFLLDVPLAFVLALLAALLSFIPNIGPVLSAAPAVLLGFAQGPQTALWVVLLYVGVQIVESYVLAPIIDRKTVYLPPALTVLAQLTLAVFAGLLGIALATPLLAALVVLVTMLYVQDVLGRDDVRVPEH